MIFKSDDAGAWYLSSGQREAQRDNRATGRSWHINKASNKSTYRRWSRTSTTEEFHEANTPSICKEIEYQRIWREATDHGGMEGQPKGLLEALRERGLIDEVLLIRYT